jgi:hypothetical protein
MFLEQVKRSLMTMRNYTAVEVGTLMDYTGDVWIAVLYKERYRVSVFYNMDKHACGTIRCIDLLNSRAGEVEEYKTRYMTPLAVRFAADTIYNACVSVSHLGRGYARCIGHCSLFVNNDEVFRRFLERMNRSNDSDSSDYDSSDDDSSDDEWDEIGGSLTDSDENPDYDKWDFDLLAEFGGNMQKRFMGSMEEVD